MLQNNSTAGRKPPRLKAVWFLFPAALFLALAVLCGIRLSGEEEALLSAGAFRDAEFVNLQAQGGVELLQPPGGGQMPPGGPGGMEGGFPAPPAFQSTASLGPAPVEGSAWAIIALEAAILLFGLAFVQFYKRKN